MSKVGLIVEGDSDKAFFDIYFKPRYGLTRTMKVIPSGTNKKCKIMNTKDMHKNIKSLELKGYKDIYILIDLDSTCKKEVYHCEVELRNDYIAKIGLKKITNVKVIVVSSEIEAWMLSALKKSNKTTKEHLNSLLQLCNGVPGQSVPLEKIRHTLSKPHFSASVYRASLMIGFSLTTRVTSLFSCLIRRRSKTSSPQLSPR